MEPPAKRPPNRACHADIGPAASVGEAPAFVREVTAEGRQRRRSARFGVLRKGHTDGNRSQDDPNTCRVYFYVYCKNI
jgi:hypothetical protein